MNATDAMFHLDAVARSVPEPVLPPNARNTQVSGILHATRPLLDTDHDWILQNIEVLQQQISAYDALLDHIDEVKSEIQRHRDTVQKPMAVYSSALAPIRRLPSELCRVVFREIQLSMWSNCGSLEDHQALDFSQGPWKLSHVCSAWRDIVLSYPQLWSHIVLNYRANQLLMTQLPVHYRTSQPSATQRHCSTAPALQTMILRSAPHPLDIAFSLEDKDKEIVAFQAFSMILEESCRWRSMDLQIPLTLLEQLKVVRGKLPCLESLTMRTSSVTPFGRRLAPKNIRGVFIDAPHLRKVVLDRRFEFGDFMFPLRITHLATDMASSLKMYQSLVECHLFPKVDSNSIPSHSVHLPNVRRLFVLSSNLLAHLCLPSLDDLIISGDPSMSDTHTNVLMMNEFVRRSHCTLTRLAIHHSISGDHIFIKDCLLLMNSLVSLEIGNFLNVDVKAILDALTSIGFLPNLQHLSLRIPYMQSSFWEPLTAMVSSRSRCLRSIRLCARAGDVESVNEYLAPLLPPDLLMMVSMDSVISDFGGFEYE